MKLDAVNDSKGTAGSASQATAQMMTPWMDSESQIASSFGVAMGHIGYNQVVIKKGEKLPHTETHTFTSSVDWQPYFKIELLWGDFQTWARKIYSRSFTRVNVRVRANW